MKLIFSVLWGLITLSAMLLTYKFYVPYLETKRKSIKTSEEKNDNNLHKISGIALIIISVICSLISAVAGYRFAGGISESIVSGLIVFTLANGVLSCIFVTDMQLKIIPNVCVIVALGVKAITFVIDFVMYRERFRDSVLFSFITGFICLILLLVVSKITHDGIGMGDVKLLSTIGFLCGLKSLFFTVLFAFGFASVVSLVLVIIKRKTFKDSIPFGPMFWIGFQISVLLLFV